MNGRLVRTLINEVKPAGDYTVQWNSDGLDNGIYFARSLTGDISRNRH